MDFVASENAADWRQKQRANYPSWQSCFWQFQADGNIFVQTKTLLQEWTPRRGDTRVDATIVVKKQWLLRAIACLHWPHKASKSLVWLVKPTCSHIQSYPISLQTSISALAQPDSNVWQSPGDKKRGGNRTQQTPEMTKKKKKNTPVMFLDPKKREREKEHPNKSVHCSNKKKKKDISVLSVTSKLFPTVLAVVLQRTNQIFPPTTSRTASF